MSQRLRSLQSVSQSTKNGFTATLLLTRPPLFVKVDFSMPTITLLDLAQYHANNSTMRGYRVSENNFTFLATGSGLWLTLVN